MAEKVVHPEDVLPVSSRVSWSAILAGSVVAMAVMALLSVLAGGIGLSLSETGMRESTAAWTRVITTIFLVCVALFAGGCVAGRLTIGETRSEGAINGVLVWATVSAMCLGLAGMGASTSYQLMLGTAAISRPAGAATSDPAWEQALRAGGFSQDRIDAAKKVLAPDNRSDEGVNRKDRENARQVAMWITWGTFAGMVLSMLSAIWGAMLGAGEEVVNTVRLRLLQAGRHRVVVRTAPNPKVSV